MTQTDPKTWCERVQIRLMAVIDAMWESIEHSDDPAVLHRAREKIKVCGVLAATARKVMAIRPEPKPARGPLPDLMAEAAGEVPSGRTLDRLKGGRRGRL